MALSQKMVDNGLFMSVGDDFGADRLEILRAFDRRHPRQNPSPVASYHAILRVRTVRVRNFGHLSNGLAVTLLEKYSSMFRCPMYR